MHLKVNRTIRQYIHKCEQTGKRVYACTLPFKFLKVLYLIKNTEKTVILQFKLKWIYIFMCNLFLLCQSWVFSIISHMILHKAFQYADLMLKKHLLLLSILKTGVLPNFFCGDHDSLTNGKFKIIFIWKIEMFCNIINAI